MFIWKGLIRKPLVTVLCVLLLAMAVLLPLLGAAMRQSSQVTSLPIETLDLAVLRMDIASRIIKNVNGDIEVYEGVDDTFSDRYTVDVRTFGAAYSQGMLPADAAVSENSPINMVILIGTCTNVEQAYNDRTKIYRNTCTFEIDETVYQSEWNPIEINTVQYNDSVKTADTLEVGKKYLFWGCITANSESDIPLVTLPVNRTTPTAVKTVAQEGLHWIKEANKGAGNYMPLFSELNGSLEEFMQTEAGQIWQEAVFSKIEVCESAFAMVGTDYLESIPAWNAGDCSLIAGEVFTQKQYENGEKVCLISEEVASLNGLQVGDILPLKLFSSDAIYDNMGYMAYQNTYDPYAGFLDEGEWRVIGIYATDYIMDEDYQIHPNVIFVPNQTVTCFRENIEWRGTRRPGMESNSAVSVVLPKDGWEQFDLQAGLLGYGGFFDYNDGNAAEKKAAWEKEQSALTTWQETVEKKTELFPIISAVLMFAAMLIYVLSKKREIEQLYTIETPYGKLFVHIFAQALIVGAVALGISVAAAGFAVPPLAVSMLSRLADPAYADAWLSSMTVGSGVTLTALGRPVLILFGTILISCLIGIKRKFRFEYHEKE